MIITLCGSARFERWFHAWSEALSRAGHLVFGLCAYPSGHEGQKDWYDDEDKRAMDAVHREKIARSDAVLFLNVYAYLGSSTLDELVLAKDKRILFLESWGKGIGIGPKHHDVVREAARSFGVPEGYGSPVDTFHYPSPYDRDLLGSGGPRRIAIVDDLRKKTDWTRAKKPKVEPLDLDVAARLQKDVKELASTFRVLSDVMNELALLVSHESYITANVAEPVLARVYEVLRAAADERKST